MYASGCVRSDALLKLFIKRILTFCRNGMDKHEVLMFVLPCFLNVLLLLLLGEFRAALIWIVCAFWLISELSILCCVARVVRC